MGKNYLNNCQSIANTKDFTLKQMFDISTILVSEQDEISRLETIGWENHSWKYLSLIGDERVINLQRTKVYVLSDSVLCLGRILEDTQSNDAWEQRLGWLKSSQNYRNFDRIDGEPMEFEWNIFPGSNTAQLGEEVKRLLLRLDETPENFTGRIIFMSMFNDISCGSQDNEEECLANAKLVSLYAKRFGKGQWWSFIGPGSEKKWYCISEECPQGVWDKMAERMLLEFAESGCPIFGAATPLSWGRFGKQRTWKTVDTPSSRRGNDWHYFSHNCLCKPAQSLRSNRGDVWRIWNPSWKNGETRCDGAIKFLTRAECDQDRSTFGLWWPGQPRSSVAAIWRTNWKAVTTRQIEQILYGCRIFECCWNWTILHDERHCRIFTISCSGLSWIHSSKRRRNITTKRMDPRKHKDWARIRNCNQLLAW